MQSGISDISPTQVAGGHVVVVGVVGVGRCHLPPEIRAGGPLESAARNSHPPPLAGPDLGLAHYLARLIYTN